MMVRPIFFFVNGTFFDAPAIGIPELRLFSTDAETEQARGGFSEELATKKKSASGV